MQLCGAQKHDPSKASFPYTQQHNPPLRVEYDEKGFLWLYKYCWMIT